MSESPRQATLAERLGMDTDRRVAGGDGGDDSLDRATLDRLTECERGAYVAVEWNGYAPRDFARSTDRTPSTARTLLMRARRKMGVSAE
jgi:DNA-directed RNA polymerase specialized sigma24 family protein